MSDIGFSDFWSQQIEIKIMQRYVHDCCVISSVGNVLQMWKMTQDN